MTSMRDVIREWRQLLSLKQDFSPIRFALSGDGSDAATADMGNRSGWAWVRYDEEQNKVSQIRNRKMPGIPQNVPVVIGKEFVTDRYMQILGVNWPLYDMFVTYPELISHIVPPHGDSHHAVYGSDPAYIDVRNILNGRVRPTIPTSLSVYVESLAYEYEDTRSLFGGSAVDMTGYIPGVANTHRYVLINIDAIAQVLELVPGDIAQDAAPADLPDVSIWRIPLGVVLMYSGMTTILEADIFDMRIMFNPTGTYNTYRNFVQYMNHNDLMWVRHLSGEI